MHQFSELYSWKDKKILKNALLSLRFLTNWCRISPHPAKSGLAEWLGSSVGRAAD